MGSVRAWARRTAAALVKFGKRKAVRRVVIGAGALVALAVVFVLLWRGPWMLDRVEFSHSDRKVEAPQATVVSGFRTALAALVVAVAGIGGLYFTSRTLRVTQATLAHTQQKDREQNELTRESQVTDRYIKAVGLLTTAGTDAVTARMAGVYALQRIMRDSPKDHDTVVQLLAAFVRERSPRSRELPDPAPESFDDLPLLPNDVQAALAVLANRPEREEQEPVDLSRANLHGAHLPGARFDGALFSGSRLDGALLTGARLRGANFYQASLQRVMGDGADLSHAWLMEADLGRADLMGANLQGATLYGASLLDAALRNADLAGTYLAPAELLRPNGFEEARVDGPGQFLQARMNQDTKLPSSVAEDQAVVERIKECEQDSAVARAE